MVRSIAGFFWVRGRGLAALLVFAVLSMAGCAKRESRQVGHTTDTTLVRTDSTVTVPPLGIAPLQPRGVQVAHSDSLLNAIAPKLAPWVAMWKEADPAFKPDSLFRIGRGSAFRKGDVQPLADVYPPSEQKEPVFLILSAPSPDRKYNLIFDWYQAISEHGSEVDIGGDADSAPLLLDLRGGTSNRFEFCGTPCGFHWGVWLSPTRFALAGWQEADASRKWIQGRLSIYSIADSTSTTYVTRPVSTGSFARYNATWEAWVVSKYRALKPTSIRS